VSRQNVLAASYMKRYRKPWEKKMSGEEDEPLKQTRSHKILEKRGKLSYV
jgi:hypothetical protein